MTGKIYSNDQLPCMLNANDIKEYMRISRTQAYLSSYFLECEYINGFDIYYRIDCFEDKAKMYGCNFEPDNYAYSQTKNSMFVNDLVLRNTEAGEKVQLERYSQYTEYNYIFANLAKNLKKEANGK